VCDVHKRAPRTRNMVGEVPVEFDMLILAPELRYDRSPADDGLCQAQHAVPVRLPGPARGVEAADFRFPCPSTRLFRSNQLVIMAKANRRGFILRPGTAGRDTDRPVDRSAGEKLWCPRTSAGRPPISGVGKSFVFFLTDARRNVIIVEAAGCRPTVRPCASDRIIRGRLICDVSRSCARPEAAACV